MGTTGWIILAIVLAIVIVAVILFLRARAGRQADENRVQAAQIRQQAAPQAVAAQGAQSTASASAVQPDQAHQQPEAARAQAAAATQHAEQVQVQSDADARLAQRATDQYGQAVRHADALDPDVSTDDGGNRLDGDGRQFGHHGQQLGHDEPTVRTQQVATDGSSVAAEPVAAEQDAPEQLTPEQEAEQRAADERSRRTVSERYGWPPPERQWSGAPAAEGSSPQTPESPEPRYGDMGGEPGSARRMSADAGSAAGGQHAGGEAGGRFGDDHDTDGDDGDEPGAAPSRAAAASEEDEPDGPQLTVSERYGWPLAPRRNADGPRRGADDDNPDAQA